MPHKRVRVAAGSVRGAAHRRSGAPNQDAVRWTKRAGVDGGLVAAVADGHGNARSFRSASGARIATECAVDVLATPVVDGQGLVAEVTVRKLLRQWRGAVEADIAARPFSDDELEVLVEREGSEAVEALRANPLLAYGTTLLAVVVSGGEVHYVQLGDGEILAVTDDGQVARPVPADERLLGGQTTSVSNTEAWQDVRRARADRSRPPRLVLLCTDGYTDSFEDNAGFFKAGTDFLRMVQHDGIATVEARLERWLAETTELGAGDDATLALVEIVSDEPRLPVVTGGQRRGSVRMLVAAAVALLTVAGLVGTTLTRSDPSAEAAADPSPPATQEAPRSSDRAVQPPRTDVPAPTTGRWVQSEDGRTLVLRDGDVIVTTLDVDAPVADMAQTEDGVWALLESGVVIGVQSDQPTAPLFEVEVDSSATLVVVDDDVVWLIDPVQGLARGIDAHTGSPTGDKRAIDPDDDERRLRLERGSVRRSLVRPPTGAVRDDCVHRAACGG